MDPCSWKMVAVSAGGARMRWGRKAQHRVSPLLTLGGSRGAEEEGVALSTLGAESAVLSGYLHLSQPLDHTSQTPLWTEAGTCYQDGGAGVAQKA